MHITKLRVAMQAHPLVEEESASLAGGSMWDLSAPAADAKQGSIRGRSHKAGLLPAQFDIRWATQCQCACQTQQANDKYVHAASCDDHTLCVLAAAAHRLAAAMPPFRPAPSSDVHDVCSPRLLAHEARQRSAGAQSMAATRQSLPIASFRCNLLMLLAIDSAAVTCADLGHVVAGSRSWRQCTATRSCS